jgi:poly-gamma-glutamate synthesis protein (capsule biosynthesis protein)
VTAQDQLLDAAWEELPSWAIVPFETLDARWKVLTVDGQSPIRKDFDIEKYPLVVNFSLTAQGVDASRWSCRPSTAIQTGWPRSS